MGRAEPRSVSPPDAAKGMITARLSSLVGASDGGRRRREASLGDAGPYQTAVARSSRGARRLDHSGCSSRMPIGRERVIHQEYAFAVNRVANGKAYGASALSSRVGMT